MAGVELAKKKSRNSWFVSLQASFGASSEVPTAELSAVQSEEVRTGLAAALLCLLPS